jgi:hypothetical protein
MSVRFQIAVNPSWRAKNSKGITMPNMLKRELFITFFFLITGLKCVKVMEAF